LSLAVKLATPASGEHEGFNTVNGVSAWAQIGRRVAKVSHLFRLPQATE
jgi:hypothetical protein